MAWEYASILSDGPAKKDTLDALGADRWELVSVLQGARTQQLLYVFKRPSSGAPASENVVPAAQPESPAEATRTDPLF